MLKRCAFFIVALRAFVAIPDVQHAFFHWNRVSLGGSEIVAVPIAPAELEPLIHRSAAQYHVDPALVKAVIANESGFSSVATSRVGAQGLMQLMPSTAASLGVRNSYDPAQNVAGGTRYLRGLYNRFRNWKLAVAAYNAGPEAVHYYGGIPPYPETQNYVHSVFRSLQRYLISERATHTKYRHSHRVRVARAHLKKRHYGRRLAHRYARRHQYEES